MRTALILVVFLSLASCKNAPEPPKPPDPAAALAIAEALAACEIAGDRACAAKLLDLGEKARGIFGDVYLQGSEEDRRGTRSMLLDLFMSAGPGLRRGYFSGGTGTWSIASAGEQEVVVVEAGEGLSFEYLVARNDGELRIRDRIRLRGEHRADPRILVEKFLKDFHAAQGRDATLAEINSELPAFLGTHRARTVKIPKGARKGPAPVGTR